jgi:hypothetical protein
VTGVIPGLYNIVAVGITNTVQVTATQRIDLTGGGVPGITLALRQGLNVPGQVYVQGTPPANFQVTSTQIQLQSADNLDIRNAQVRVSSTGSFILQDVVPGARYRVSLNVPSGGYVIAARYGEENPLNSPITVEDEATPLQLQLGFTPGRIDAVVMEGDKPLQGVLTVLVPHDRGRFDLYRTTNSAAEGKVSFSNVPPGDYKVFAWEEVKEGAWQDPLFMEKFEDKGRTIHFDNLGSSSENVQLIKAEGY